MIIWPVKISTEFSNYEFDYFIIATPNVRQKLRPLHRVDQHTDSDFRWCWSNQNELIIASANQRSSLILLIWNWWTLAITFLIGNSYRAWCPTVRQNTSFEHISIYKLFYGFRICIIGLFRDVIFGEKFPKNRFPENRPFWRSIPSLASSLQSSRYFFDS